MSDLAVYLRARRVGTLAPGESGRDYTFAFARELVEDAPGEIVVSVSLPVREDPYESLQARPFFEGLLPEGALREQIARNLHISEENSFGLLTELGQDSAGALVLLKEGEELTDFPVEWLTDQELAELVRKLPTRPLGVSGASKVRLSLAGLQRKAVLIRSGEGIFGTPTRSAPSTHILKPQYPDTPYSNLVYNEAFCMRVAHCVGLPVARTELIFVGETPCLLVERFDRTDEGGVRARLHQEDCCQALGVLPGRKYEGEGGPGLAALVGLLRDVSARAGADVLVLLRAVVVNLVLGNHDAHGKNFALLYGQRGIQLAPLYDIVSTAVYPDVENSLAMAIGGELDPDRVDAGQVRKLAEDCELNPRQLSEEWISIATRTAECAASVADLMKVEGLHVPVLDTVVAHARRRAAEIANIAR